MIPGEGPHRVSEQIHGSGGRWGTRESRISSALRSALATHAAYTPEGGRSSPDVPEAEVAVNHQPTHCHPSTEVTHKRGGPGGT